MCDVLQLLGTQPAEKGPRQVSEREVLFAPCGLRTAASGRRSATSHRRSGGRLAGQPFEFRNQMLECVEILDGRH